MENKYFYDIQITAQMEMTQKLVGLAGEEGWLRGRFSHCGQRS